MSGRASTPGISRGTWGLGPVAVGTDPTHLAPGAPMLWTILIVLVIIALALFIFSRLRGGRGV